MCLIAFDWSPASDIPLTLLANRDEFHARPALPVHWWEGAQLLAGQDLQSGGSWLGVTLSGRLAAVTNHRAPQRFDLQKMSRGDVVTQFLQGKASAMDFCLQLQHRAHLYNDFNLLVFDGSVLLGFESRRNRIVVPTPGVCALSNADFDTDWPKALTLKDRLRRTLFKYETSLPSEDELLDLLSDEAQAPDGLLPNTGLPLARERLLSSAFIRSADYGTRASSLVRFWHRRVTFVERRFDASGPLGASRFTFQVWGG